MFEKIIDQLHREYLALTNRLDIGKKKLDDTDKNDSKYSEYVRHYN